MANEEEKDIIDLEKNNEEEKDLDLDNSDDKSELDSNKDYIDNKPIESLEDKEARLERQLAQTRKKLGKDVSKPEKNSSKSNEFGYAEKAFLATQGFKGSKEFEFVQSELKKAGGDLDGLLENDYFKSRLETFRNINKTTEATPMGNKRSGSGAVDSVEYWLTKPIEEVPQNMRIKVVNARLAKESNKEQFYNS